ncbi:hypothetical protein HHI36_015585 [Cryptolaemus montrouzieri]|uniref:Uncharacterized protein n=1 Tax=Cryptolaemus montrouzieri TaxID=559131 RepID=A0ABD2N600_9CUCU
MARNGHGLWMDTELTGLTIATMETPEKRKTITVYCRYSCEYRTDINSDHNPVVSKLEIKLKLIDRKSTGRPIDIRKVQIFISNTITNATNNNDSNLDQWDKVKQAIQATSTQLIQKEKTRF